MPTPWLGLHVIKILHLNITFRNLLNLNVEIQDNANKNLKESMISQTASLTAQISSDI